MNALVIAALATNVLFHPWWETGNYTSNMCARNGMNMEMTNKVHWMMAHTTTNAPSFHLKAWAEHGWTTFEWTDSLTTGTWWMINCNHKQYFGQLHRNWTSNGLLEWRETPVFKVYMHPESVVTKKMLASDAGFFRQKTHWRSRIIKVDMEGFWPEPPKSTNAVSVSSGPPPIPGG